MSTDRKRTILIAPFFIVLCFFIYFGWFKRTEYGEKDYLYLIIGCISIVLGFLTLYYAESIKDYQNKMRKMLITRGSFNIYIEIYESIVGMEVTNPVDDKYRDKVVSLLNLTQPIHAKDNDINELYRTIQNMITNSSFSRKEINNALKSYIDVIQNCINNKNDSPATLVNYY